MGQRLNLEITTSDFETINVYYHWLGFTDSILRLGSVLAGLEDTTLEGVIELLEGMGARFYGTEEEELLRREILVQTEGLDRNLGLIAITEAGMKMNRSWEEARLTFRYDTNRVNLEKSFWKVTDIPTIIKHHESAKEIHQGLWCEIDKYEEWLKMFEDATENDVFIWLDEMYMWIG